GNFSVEVPCQDDNVLFILLNDLPVDPGDVIESLGIGDGRHFGEVVVSVLVLGQQHDLVSVVLSGLVFMVLADEEFAADNSLQLPRLGGFVIGKGGFIFGPDAFVVGAHFLDKMEGSHHIGVIG